MKTSWAWAAVVVLLLTAGGVTSSRNAWAAPNGDVDACANAAEESQSLRKDGKLTLAREKLLVCARSTCPAFIQKDCATWLAEVDKNLPSIVLRAIDAKGKDVTAVKVTADGKVITEKLDGRPLVIDPGEHTMIYETDGAPPLKETLLIRQGEANRMVSVSFASASGPPPATITTPPASSEKKPAIPLTSWVLGGAGIVLGGVGAALWISGKGDHSDMESSCARTQSCLQSDVDSAQTRLLIATSQWARASLRLASPS